MALKRASCSIASAMATKAPVMEAVRVPPSACSTSQSSMMVRSPSAAASTMARRERPIKRWISCVRPEGRPLEISRGVRFSVERGSMEYTAVTQPLPLPRRNCGTLSSTEAAQSTRVFPTVISADPSAVFRYPVSMLTGRIWSGFRSSSLVGMSHYIDEEKDSQQHTEDEQDDATHAPLRRGGLRLSAGSFQLGHKCDGSSVCGGPMEEVFQDTKRALAQVFQ